MKEKWTVKEPKPSSLIVCYYSNSSMIYWISASGSITDAYLGHIDIENKHHLRQIKKGYWKYANVG